MSRLYPQVIKTVGGMSVPRYPSRIPESNHGVHDHYRPTDRHARRMGWGGAWLTALYTGGGVCQSGCGAYRTPHCHTATATTTHTQPTVYNLSDNHGTDRIVGVMA